MLRLRQAQLQQHIQTEQEQLVRIKARLRSLEQGSYLPTYEVVLKSVKSITAVSMHLAEADLTHQVHWSDILSATLKRYGVKPIDHLLVLHSEGRLASGLGLHYTKSEIDHEGLKNASLEQ